MRKIALIGMLLSAIAIVGCSKKTEEQANESMKAPEPASQEAAPAPMQNMDSMGKPAEPAPGESQGQPQEGQAPAPAPAAGQ
jgi:hypothetical protein